MADGATIHALPAAGHSERSVARQLGLSQNTILRCVRERIVWPDAVEPPFKGRRALRQEGDEDSLPQGMVAMVGSACRWAAAEGNLEQAALAPGL